MQNLEVLLRPIITEKGTMLQGQGKYVFEVANSATKHQISQAVEKAFQVEVEGVNIVRIPAKWRGPGRRRGLTSQSKKAIVSIKQGQKIEFFEGL